ncbi:MAG: hypothetical protein IJH07_01320 [Ruminococcus sp.]|nr:hypothetical protein [Ruminococcus sp.]
MGILGGHDRCVKAELVTVGEDIAGALIDKLRLTIDFYAVKALDRASLVTWESIAVLIIRP